MTPNPDPALLLKQLDRACRVGFLVVTALFAYIAIRLSLSIGYFETIFRDMFGGGPLPLWTQLVLSGQSEFLAMSFILPATAILIAFKAKRPDHAVIGISLCSFGLFLLSLVMSGGLMRPMFAIISSLTGESPAP